MFKSVQIKMILIIIALAVVMLAIPEYIYLARLNNLNVAQNPEMLAQSIVTWKIVLSILTGSFLIISTIIVIFTSKNVVSPISKLIKKVERIAAGDETEQIELKEVDNGKSNTEIDELVKAFNVMTAGLKENLNEVTRQKMQIETILLHMTDGIIAFNIDGSIIHINPAASRLLKITADDNTFDKIFKKLKIEPENINLYYKAFTHTSFSNENPSYESYERLEFLGDAVLELIVSEYLYKERHLEEGEMTKKRASLVCENALARFASDLKFAEDIKLGSGEISANNTILADVFEAFIAALYLDKGYDYTREIVLSIIVKYDKQGIDFLKDYKSTLQELVQTDKKSVHYSIVNEKGPAHNKTFTCEVKVGNIVMGRGVGSSKKAAEQEAARVALAKCAKHK